MTDWKPYFNDRLRKDHSSGFVVIVPVQMSPVVPLKCPVCGMLMSTADDAEYFREKTCCYKCGLKWADSNREKWLSGWRPTSEEISVEVEYRQSIPVSLSLEAFSK